MSQKKLLVKVEEGFEEMAILVMFKHLTGRDATLEEIEEMRVELAADRVLREARARSKPES